MGLYNGNSKEPPTKKCKRVLVPWTTAEENVLRLAFNKFDHSWTEIKKAYRHTLMEILTLTC